MVMNPFFVPKKPRLDIPEVQKKKKNRNGSTKKKIRQAKEKSENSEKSEKSEKSGKTVLNNIESVHGNVYLVSNAKDLELLKQSQH